MKKQITQKIIEAVFPRFCVGCGREGEFWCSGCESAWSSDALLAACPFCRQRGSDRVCSGCRSEVYLDGVSACGAYGNPTLRKALGIWKYHGDREIEGVLEKWVRMSAVRAAPPVAPYFVCSIPLHIGRERARGFNQADQVALWAAQQYGLGVEEVLERVKATEPQARQGSGRRVGEMDEVFCVRPGARVPDHVLLCDDVFTSGATMDAAARVLKENGAKTVWGFVIARGA